MKLAIRAAVCVLAFRNIDAQQSRPLSETEREAFIERGWESGIPPDEARVRAKFGTPRSQEREKVPNPHVPGQTDEIATLRYAGFEITFYKTSTSTFVTNVAIISPNITVKHDLNVGSPAARVEALLGSPDETESNNLIFAAHVGYEADVAFQFNNGRISRIVWHSSVD